MSFAARLKQLRETAKLTQQELADKAGLHRVAVARLETGEREPSWATVRAIVHALGVSCEAFDEVSVHAVAKSRGMIGKATPAGADQAEAKKPRRKKAVDDRRSP